MPFFDLFRPNQPFASENSKSVKKMLQIPFLDVNLGLELSKSTFRGGAGRRQQRQQPGVPTRPPSPAQGDRIIRSDPLTLIIEKCNSIRQRRIPPARHSTRRTIGQNKNLKKTKKTSKRRSRQQLGGTFSRLGGHFGIIF